MKHSLCNIKIKDTPVDISPNEVTDFCNDKFYYDLEMAVRKLFPECDLRWSQEISYSNMTGVTVVLRVMYKILSQQCCQRHWMEEFHITRFVNKPVYRDFWRTDNGHVASGYNIDIKVPYDQNSNYYFSATAIKKFISSSSQRWKIESGRKYSDVNITFDEMKQNYDKIIKCIVETRKKTIRTEIQRDKELAQSEANAKTSIELNRLDVQSDLAAVFEKHHMSWQMVDSITSQAMIYELNANYGSWVGVRFYPDHMELDMEQANQPVYTEQMIIKLLHAALQRDEITKGIMLKTFSYDDSKVICLALDVMLTYIANIQRSMSHWTNQAYMEYRKYIKPDTCDE